MQVDKLCLFIGKPAPNNMQMICKMTHIHINDWATYGNSTPRLLGPRWRPHCCFTVSIARLLLMQSDSLSGDRPERPTSSASSPTAFQRGRAPGPAPSIFCHRLQCVCGGGREGSLLSKAEWTLSRWPLWRLNDHGIRAPQDLTVGIMGQKPYQPPGLGPRGNLPAPLHLLHGLRAGGVLAAPGLSLMNTSVCDHHFFPWECNDDVISRALLWVCEHQTHDPSSPVNCLGEGINLVPCNIEERFVGLQQGACRQADDLARPGGSAPPRPARAY